MRMFVKAIGFLIFVVPDALNNRRALRNYCHRLDITDRLLALKDEYDRKGIAHAAE